MTQESPWYVVLTQPQQDIQTVWRMHELGLELYVPIVREKRSTKKKDVHGRKIVVLHPRPMFRGYGFIRSMGRNADEIESKAENTRGFSSILRYGATGNPCLLPHEAVLAIRRIETENHQDLLRGSAKGSRFKRGDRVRVDEGSVYSGLVADVERTDAKGRVELLLGMIRHWMPEDMVVAA